ncbi:WGxxGxxG-CTERM domain-containing protein [Tolypothrix sp. FACHB-123]|uniref:WGxxGxxG family protein n=1 Tax=Tolypothrix sp. FACHB-123 TaxID=2692868 RepID=UPI001685C7A9|nr:WGxxGxxG family protein [Tolypothrix sp. FACHB-123]MBD2358071.1 WGxxGxxG-CTERM domain-containing protein [Tolypothrix sp. FACHB-123]
MKRFGVSKIVGTTVLALSLAIAPTVLPASAQTNTNPDGTTTGTTTTDTTTTDRPLTDGNYADGDWGLLGLLGLFGLLGRKSRRDDNTAYSNRDVVGSTRSNF